MSDIKTGSVQQSAPVAKATPAPAPKAAAPVADAKATDATPKDGLKQSDELKTEGTKDPKKTDKADPNAKTGDGTSQDEKIKKLEQEIQDLKNGQTQPANQAGQAQKGGGDQGGGDQGGGASSPAGAAGGAQPTGQAGDPFSSLVAEAQQILQLQGQGGQQGAFGGFPGGQQNGQGGTQGIGGIQGGQQGGLRGAGGLQQGGHQGGPQMQAMQAMRGDLSHKAMQMAQNGQTPPANEKQVIVSALGGQDPWREVQQQRQAQQGQQGAGQAQFA